ncbi:PREDICTED: uncharacterized protein LOC106149757 [Chinchilla lanigera]|uniref:uncharacterized protein LOC106149757 n=1 Tax=Chinchilla lanigera TaxID=34839 RepID=UPI0006966678|nr:PREDICTED: uncharacterized protein LOC106149757 [Chinchilla lanigera]
MANESLKFLLQFPVSDYDYQVLFPGYCAPSGTGTSERVPACHGRGARQDREIWILDCFSHSAGSLAPPSRQTTAATQTARCSPREWHSKKPSGSPKPRAFAPPLAAPPTLECWVMVLARSGQAPAGSAEVKLSSPSKFPPHRPSPQPRRSLQGSASSQCREHRSSWYSGDQPATASEQRPDPGTWDLTATAKAPLSPAASACGSEFDRQGENMTPSPTSHCAPPGALKERQVKESQTVGSSRTRLPLASVRESPQK